MHSDPIALFLTWTCYGTWLPGDSRGSTRWQRGSLPSRPLLENWCREKMSEPAVLLTDTQRDIVVKTITEHAVVRGWQLHGLSCRSNHCHVVVTAPEYAPELVRDQFKSWSSRRLNADQRRQGAKEVRERWWTKGGSCKLVFDETSLLEVVQYVCEAQDKGGSKGNA